MLVCLFFFLLLSVYSFVCSIIVIQVTICFKHMLVVLLPLGLIVSFFPLLSLGNCFVVLCVLFWGRVFLCLCVRLIVFTNLRSFPLISAIVCVCLNVSCSCVLVEIVW